MGMTISYDEVMASSNPAAYAMQGPMVGYEFVGALSYENEGAVDQTGIMPPHAARHMSLHRLTPPGNPAVVILMYWHVPAQVWVPQSQRGSRRAAFTTAYLAAAGWSWKGEA